jgi:NADH-quinone oxidoreductase subunit L
MPFSKPCYSLGAGSVIHYVHSNEMKDMGGLRKMMPITHITFLLACLAIAGIPPFAGFFSKEEILTACFNANKFIFGAAILTAGLTAFYMFRLYFNIFWNKEYKSHQSHDEHHHGEAPKSMLFPLLLLAGLSLVAGFVPFSKLVTADGAAFETEFHFGFAIGPVLLALAAISLAWKMYAKENGISDSVSNSIKGLYTSAYRKFYFDEIYLFITQKLLLNLVGKPAAWIDKNIFDGFDEFDCIYYRNNFRFNKNISIWKGPRLCYLLFCRNPRLFITLHLFVDLKNNIICKKGY